MKKEKLNTIYIKPPKSGDHCPFISIEISWPAHKSLLHNSDYDSSFLQPFPLPRPLVQMAIDSVLHNVSKSYPNRILIGRGIWAGSLKEAPICVPCSLRPSSLSPLPRFIFLGVHRPFCKPLLLLCPFIAATAPALLASNDPQKAVRWSVQWAELPPFPAVPVIDSTIKWMWCGY